MRELAQAGGFVGSLRGEYPLFLFALGTGTIIPKKVKKLSQTRIASVDRGSPAKRAGVKPGETLTAVNGHAVADVLDYKYYTYESRLNLTLSDGRGKTRTVNVTKEDGEDLGLNFETYLMDCARSCANRCVFCFVDQLPPGMRETLYFKDDDARLSFLMGNYITLTNLSEREARRIIDLHISPINISVHSTDPELRSLLLGSRNGGRGLELIRRFAQADITMNCQIVTCPGLNDGAQLQKSMEDLASMFPAVSSVSIVPVGLTRHRQGLYPLEPYTHESAAGVVDLVEAYARLCRDKVGTSLFWCSDEFYLKANRTLPEDKYYEDHTQLENGVGMLRLLETEFMGALEDAEEVHAVAPFSVATGVAAAPFLREMIDRAASKCHTEFRYKVFPIINRFFGETVDVAGLVTGGDLIAQLSGKDLGTRLLLPVNMLRHGEDMFLDDVRLSEAEKALNIPITAIEQDGYALFDAIFQI